MPERKLLLYSLFLFVCIGCIKRIPINQPSGLVLSAAETSRTLSAMREKQQGFKTLKSLYYTIVEYGKRRERFRQVFIFSSPDKLRLEILPTTSSYSMGVLVSEGGFAQYADNQSSAIQTGPTDELLSQLLNFKVQPDGLVHALLGFVPAEYLEPSKASTYFDTERGAQIFSNDGLFNAVFSTDDYTLQSAQLVDPESGDLVLELSYADYKRAGNYSVPHRLNINIVQKDIIARLSAGLLELNKTLKPELFREF